MADGIIRQKPTKKYPSGALKSLRDSHLAQMRKAGLLGKPAELTTKGAMWINDKLAAWRIKKGLDPKTGLPTSDKYEMRKKGGK